jgi:tetratricopeptide (TPR) repeat protein
MMRVASLTNLSDRQLDRLIRRVALLAVVVLIAFVAFYVLDRYRAPQASMVDREVAALEDAVRANPADVSSRGRLADLYLKKGLFAQAITQYDEILKTGKADTQAHYGRGEANRLSGQLAGAITDYQAVVDALKGGEQANVDRTLEGAYLGLGMVALDQGRPKDAIDPLQRALGIVRSDADALNLLGSAYVRTGDPGKAIDVLDKAIAFVPFGWAEPYVTLASAYTQKSDTAHAEWAAAMADLSNGQPVSAETRLKALVGGPAALDAAIGLGLVAETRGDTGTATQWYQKALALDSQNASAKLGLSRVAPAASPAASGAPAASAAPAAASPVPSLPMPGQLQGGKP